MFNTKNVKNLYKDVFEYRWAYIFCEGLFDSTPATDVSVQWYEASHWLTKLNSVNTDDTYYWLIQE